MATQEEVEENWKEAILELAKNYGITLPEKEKEWLETLEDALDTDPSSLITLTLALEGKAWKI